MKYSPVKLTGADNPDETAESSLSASPPPDSEPSRAPAADDSIFDLDALGKLFSGDMETIGTVLHEFVADVRRLMRKLQSSLDEGDPAASMIKAHTIKGAAAMSGAVALRQAAEKIETAAAGKDTEIARIGFADLKIRYDELVRHLVDIGLVDPSAMEPIP